MSGPPKGIPRVPGSGRKVGTPNKRTLEVQEVARNIVGHPDVHAKWLQDALDGTLPSAVIQTLLYYAYGRPKEQVELSGDADKPLVLILRRGMEAS